MTERPRIRVDAPPRETPKIRQTLMEDMRSSDLPTTLRKDLQETYQFYLDEDRRRHLAELGPLQRWALTAFWFSHSLFFKLTPNRRVLLVLGLLLAMIGMPDNGGQVLFGLVAVLLVLVLELKDKLVAQDELLAGRAVQLSLMPAENPSIPGWDTWIYTHPANDVGGDLVDYLHVDNRRLGLALGDVAGKGLPAALLMAKLQATVRALVPLADSLDALGDEINRIFVRDGLPNRFASLFYMEVEPDSGTVRFLNAGHLPPLVGRTDGVDTLSRGAPALGLTGKTRYREDQAELEQGDLLVLYSDGLTEARNEEGEFFGDTRLKRLIPRLRNLSASTAGARLLAEIEDFVGDAIRSDDLSVVILKRTA